MNTKDKERRILTKMEFMNTDPELMLCEAHTATRVEVHAELFEYRYPEV